LAAENEQQLPNGLEVFKWASTHGMLRTHSLDHSPSDINASNEDPQLRSDKPWPWAEGAHCLHLITYITSSSLAHPSSPIRHAFRYAIPQGSTVQEPS